MPTPLIAITTARIKEGRLEDFKKFTQEMLNNIEGKQPHILAFNVFLDEEQTKMTSIQVHPDASSMDSLMQVLGQVMGEDMAEWVERADFFEIESLELYGQPSKMLLQADQPLVDSGAITRTIKPVYVAGFTRAGTK
jgi:hypothetical protein